MQVRCQTSVPREVVRAWGGVGASGAHLARRWKASCDHRCFRFTRLQPRVGPSARDAVSREPASGFICVLPTSKEPHLLPPTHLFFLRVSLSCVWRR
ncbi:hypothetical protein E2C01_040031 [Portunus trituberculatus]|uniref:Uncharacterized protein n=1 Tax=Portunus trituberculatus TaxID=210409 RepID=A0A5B7FPL7_PORTR|nr:hypothetical protein [Portunus trituberculatus]